METLLDVEVIHKTYGEGTIKSFDGNHIWIAFSNGKEARFQYPSCFDKFIICKDAEKQNCIKKDVDIWRIESGEIQREEYQKLYQKTQDEIYARRIAAEEKKLQAIRRAEAMRQQRIITIKKVEK